MACAEVRGRNAFPRKSSFKRRMSKEEVNTANVSSNISWRLEYSWLILVFILNLKSETQLEFIAK